MKSFREDGHLVYELTRSVADITETDKVCKFIYDIKPEVVIHSAAIGDIKKCEENNQLAEKVNIVGTKIIASACANINARMIFLSSDQVYNYFGTGLLYEYSRLHPTNFYAFTKIEGEMETKNAVRESHILRLSWQYSSEENKTGFDGKDSGLFINVLKAIKENKPILVGKNSRRYITYAYDTIDVIKACAMQRIPCGTYNVASENNMTTYDMIAYMMRELGVEESQITELIEIDNSFKDIKLLPTPYYLKRAGYEMPTFEQGFRRCLSLYYGR